MTTHPSRKPGERHLALLDSCPYCGHDLTVCRVPGCDKPTKRVMLCEGHWSRKQRFGNVQAGVPLRKRRSE